MSSRSVQLNRCPAVVFMLFAILSLAYCINWKGFANQDGCKVHDAKLTPGETQGGSVGHLAQGQFLQMSVFKLAVLPHDEAIHSQCQSSMITASVRLLSS